MASEKGSGAYYSVSDDPGQEDAHRHAAHEAAKRLKAKGKKEKKDKEGRGWHHRFGSVCHNSSPSFSSVFGRWLGLCVSFCC